MITDGGQLEARMQNDERKDIGKRMVVVNWIRDLTIGINI
jgi:hypothetical protein